MWNLWNEYKHCDCFLEYTHLTNDLIEYKCLRCNKIIKTTLTKKIKEGFFDTYKFSNNDNNKFILLLYDGVYLYEYLNDGEKFNEKLLPEK